MEKIKTKQHFVIPAVFVASIWAVKILEIVFELSFVKYGVLPGKTNGLYGVLFYPLIHGDLSHLFSNSAPLFVLTMGILYFYPSSAKKALAIIYFFSGILIWLFARESYHIGASGMIYGLSSFIFFSGIIRRDKKSITLALLVTFLYGGLVMGVLPIDEKVSWEGHFFGAVLGFLCAIIFRKKDRPDKYDWEEEPVKKEKLEISYDKGYPFEE
ncbi:MAG: rhomboid family intramembrane serine protease [Bacteroidetes bacterium]|nr:rhomboid family intramembrane serine protease [Bacteroidota bacterium]MBU2508591.1 rhomboid family intramembrane serine protease [Bacteroidota bacterium]